MRSIGLLLLVSAVALGSGRGRAILPPPTLPMDWV